MAEYNFLEKMDIFAAPSSILYIRRKRSAVLIADNLHSRNFIKDDSNTINNE
jgi:hypothetical protein